MESAKHGKVKQMETIELINAAERNLNERTARSAWDRGVKAYALEFVEELRERTNDGYIVLSDINTPKALNDTLLNGAANWLEYSWGGCSLIYDREIAERLCNPTELKRTRNGERRPNKAEEWLDTQARALTQAVRIVWAAINEETLKTLKTY